MKSDFLKNDFKMDLKTREYFSPEGIKFQKFLILNIIHIVPDTFSARC